MKTHKIGDSLTKLKILLFLGAENTVECYCLRMLSNGIFAVSSCLFFSNRPFDSTHFRASLPFFQLFHNSFFVFLAIRFIVMDIFFFLHFGFLSFGSEHLGRIFYIHKTVEHTQKVWKRRAIYTCILRDRPENALVCVRILYFVYESVKLVRCYVLSTSCVLVQWLWNRQWMDNTAIQTCIKLWMKHAHLHALFESELLRAFRFQAPYRLLVCIKLYTYTNAFLIALLCMHVCPFGIYILVIKRYWEIEREKEKENEEKNIGQKCEKKKKYSIYSCDFISSFSLWKSAKKQNRNNFHKWCFIYEWHVY